MNVCVSSPRSSVVFEKKGKETHLSLGRTGNVASARATPSSAPVSKCTLTGGGARG
jgi:hypothetical protein